MMWFFSRTARFLLVTGGIILLTSVSIDATDFLRGSQSALGLLAREVTTARCPQGMVEGEYPDRTRFCIDAYEASAHDECQYQFPGSSVETATNMNSALCVPVTEAERTPWTQVARVQAEQLCARVGKRLPTAHEWYLAAKGTPDNSPSCNVAGVLVKSGASVQCRSGVGAYDMVGNVWEWVAGEVVDGTFAGTLLPNEGYIVSVSEEGVPTATASTGVAIYNHDYFWSERVGVRAIMRGGFHGSRDDAGVYALHGAVVAEFASAAVGFRCAQSL